MSGQFFTSGDTNGRSWLAEVGWQAASGAFYSNDFNVRDYWDGAAWHNYPSLCLHYEAIKVATMNSTSHTEIWHDGWMRIFYWLLASLCDTSMTWTLTHLPVSLQTWVTASCSQLCSVPLSNRRPPRSQRTRGALWFVPAPHLFWNILAEPCRSNRTWEVKQRSN